MTATWKRTTITGVLAMVLLVAGLWLGEDLSAPVPAAVLPILAAGAWAAYLVAPARTGRYRAGAAAAAVWLVLAAALVGRSTANAAFDDCIERGEVVRSALDRHRARHGVFPEHLDRLAVRRLPGRRLLRESLLRYRRTPSGYELHFSDWLVTHRATQAEAFAAQK